MKPDDEQTGANYPPKQFTKDDVLQLLGEVLTQVRPGLQPQPLSTAALKAVDAYHANRATLAHDAAVPAPARTRAK
jgi:hypothetical protein